MNFHIESQKMFEMSQKLILVENIAEKYKDLFGIAPWVDNGNSFRMKLKNGCTALVKFDENQLLVYNGGDCWREVNKDYVNFLVELQNLVDSFKQVNQPVQTA